MPIVFHSFAIVSIGIRILLHTHALSACAYDRWYMTTSQRQTNHDYITNDTK